MNRFISLAQRFFSVVASAYLLFSATTSISAAREALDKLTVQGTVEPKQVSVVYPRVAGRVEKIASDPADASKAIGYGSFVKEGTVLAQLESQTYDAALAKAKADLQLAEAKLEQARAVMNAAGVSVDIQKAKGPTDSLDHYRAVVKAESNAVEQSKAAVKLAEADVDRCTIRAPIDGMVVNYRAKAGERVELGANARSLCEIAKDESRPEIWADLPAADGKRVAVGQSVRFSLKAYPGKTFAGQVSNIRTNPLTTMVTLVVAGEKTDVPIAPYAPVDLEIDLATPSH